MRYSLRVLFVVRPFQFSLGVRVFEVSQCKNAFTSTGLDANFFSCPTHFAFQASTLLVITILHFHYFQYHTFVH